MGSLLIAAGCGSQDDAVASSGGVGGASGGENTADLCDDQIDNDGDGKTDCDDAECKVAFFDTLCSGTGGAGGGAGSGSEGVPEDDTLQDPSGVDTSDLDPLSGDVGGSGLTCIAYPTPGTAVTQGQHLSSKAIDIDCAIGDPLTNPFPVQAHVIAKVTQYTDRKCYTSMAQYDAQCKGLNACNNLIKLQTTVAGVTWTANLLHISSSDVNVGDIVPAFGVVGQCGNVGWTCSQGGDGSHLHLSLYHGDPGAGYVYPGTLLSTDCKVLTGSCAGVVCDKPAVCHASPGTCTDGLCAYPPSAPGIACDDGDACTSGDACDGSGSCSGSPMQCSNPPNQCYSSPGACSGGGCSYPPKATGTACDDGNACTLSDACNGGGICSPGAQMPCNTPPGQCFASPGACSGGTCSYSPKASATPCDDGQACTSNDQCDGLGNCSGSGSCEICDGVDNDLNGKVDDLPSCWKAIYRFLDPLTGARCWGPTPGTPPSQCASYNQEIEAFIVRTNPVANTFEGRQCSKTTDHIIVPMASADYNALLAAGYDCSLSLGYFYSAGAAPPSGQTPWTNTCRLWRFSYSAGGSGAHLFTRGADNLTGMTCEPPARADVFSNFPCFAGTPSGC